MRVRCSLAPKARGPPQRRVGVEGAGRRGEEPSENRTSHLVYIRRL